MNWLESAGRAYDNPRIPVLGVNNIVAIKRAVQRAIGIALLPDYLIETDSGLVQLIPEVDLPSFDTYFVYPDELRNSARVHAFRDFLVSKASAGATERRGRTLRLPRLSPKAKAQPRRVAAARHPAPSAISCLA